MTFAHRWNALTTDRAIQEDSQRATLFYQVQTLNDTKNFLARRFLVVLEMLHRLPGLIAQ